MEKLIPMTDFVLEQTKEFDSIVWDDLETASLNLIYRMQSYAKFLKQPLKLEMFVPCDEGGNILYDPMAIDEDAGTERELQQIYYNNAKQKVLFEGCTAKHQNTDDKGYNIIYCRGGELWVSWNKFKTIEDLTYADLKLTPTALKQIGL